MQIFSNECRAWFHDSVGDKSPTLCADINHIFIVFITLLVNTGKSTVKLCCLVVALSKFKLSTYLRLEERLSFQNRKK